MTDALRFFTARRIVSCTIEPAPPKRGRQGTGRRSMRQGPKTANGKSKSNARKSASRRGTDGPAKLSRLSKPAHLTLEEWQRELRRQFGREQKFTLRNLGDEPFFSEFAVSNPES